MRIGTESVFSYVSDKNESQTYPDRRKSMVDANVPVFGNSEYKRFRWQILFVNTRTSVVNSIFEDIWGFQLLRVPVMKDPGREYFFFFFVGLVETYGRWYDDVSLDGGSLRSVT